MYGPSRHAGAVLWICGLAGVGKSTFAERVVDHLRDRYFLVEHIDGDEFRKRYAPLAGYSRPARLAVANRMIELAWAAAREGRVAVVSTVSLMHEVHETNLRLQFEQDLRLEVVVIEASEDFRKLARSQLFAQTATEVVGREIAADYPVNVSLRVCNGGSLAQLLDVAEAWAQCIAEALRAP